MRPAPVLPPPCTRPVLLPTQGEWRFKATIFLAGLFLTEIAPFSGSRCSPTEPRHVCWSGMVRGELPRPGRLPEGGHFQPALLRSPQPGSPRARLVLQITPKGLERPCPAPHAELRGQHGLGRTGIVHVGAVPGGPITSSILRSQLAAGTALPGTATSPPLCHASPRGELRQGKTVFLKDKRKAGHFREEGVRAVARNYIFFHRLK